jgi:hypothetical protein
MKRYPAWVMLMAWALAAEVAAQKGVVPPPQVLFRPEYDRSTDGGSGRIYTAPDNSCGGGIEGRVEGVTLGMCMAIECVPLAADPQHIRVYRAVPETTSTGSTFKFEGMQVGKYDLVLVDLKRNLWEGLNLGEDTLKRFPAAVQTNFVLRVSRADAYFNRWHIHRAGIVDGQRVFGFIERIRDKFIYKQSGETFLGNQRRLEVVEMDLATDDWQFVRTRHLYRLGEPKETAPPFLKHSFVAELGGIRVVDSIKSLGTLKLPVR